MENESKTPAVREPKTPDNKRSSLTAAQESLLNVLKDPQVLGIKDVAKICKLAGVSRATFYNALKDKNFLVALEDVVQGMLTIGELPVLKNVLNKAADPLTESHHWAKMVLDMKGRLQEKVQRPAQVVVNFNVQRPPKIEKIIDITPEIVDE